MGASGSGKDSVLDGVIARFTDRDTGVADFHGLVPSIRRVQRSITRPANAGGEDHCPLSETEFMRRLEQQDFCMHWQAHGLHYGVPRDVEVWLQEGTMVLLNGSREYLSTARSVVPDLVAVLLEVSDEVQATRLKNRARERASEIEARVNRKIPLDRIDPDLHTINNDADLGKAIDVFCELVIAKSRA